MKSLLNIFDFEEYVYDRLNEDFDTQNLCDSAFAHIGLIRFSDGTSVDSKDIVKVVSDAYDYLQEQFPSSFSFVKETVNIIFLADSKKIDTMAVDENMNMYINAKFVFKFLKMDKKLVAAVIMHEALHCIYDHLSRGKNWLNARGLPVNKLTHHDNNLAADVEVNHTLVEMNVISKQRLVGEIKGLYLDMAGGNRIQPMEDILDDPEKMAKLRKLCPPPIDPDNKEQCRPEVKTSEEWGRGYKEGWNKLAELIKKYGYEKVWDILVEKGIINDEGEIICEVKPKFTGEINRIEYLVVQSMDEYFDNGTDGTDKIYEGLNGDMEGVFKRSSTYVGGYFTAVEKIVSRMYAAKHPGGGGGGGEPLPPKYNTDVDAKDLDDIDIPVENNDEEEKDNESADDNIPTKFKDDNAGGAGGSGKGSSENGNAKDIASEIAKRGTSRKENGKGTSGNGNSSSGKGSSENGNDVLGNGNGSSENGNDVLGNGNGSSGNGSSGNGSSGNGNDVLGNGNGLSGDGVLSIGGTGGFVDKGPDDKELRKSGYSDEDIKSINKVREINKTDNSHEKIVERIKKLKNSLSNSNIIKTYLEKIEVSASKFMNIWEKVLKDFMRLKTRHAGKDAKHGGANNWKRKKSIAHGVYGINRPSVAQEPQDVNICVDVSGSMDTELLEIICSQIVVFAEMYEYSGINVTPWASSCEGTSTIRFEGRKNTDKKDITKEILAVISNGAASCGGGTDSWAAVGAVVHGIQESLNDKFKTKKKDDVHVIITDGYVDKVDGIEDKVRRAVRSNFGNTISGDVTERIVWMIYDMNDENWRKNWENEIKNGKLLFIQSELIKNNKK